MEDRDDPSHRGSVRILPAEGGYPAAPLGHDLFAPMPTEVTASAMLHRAVICRYPVSITEEWALIGLTEEQVRKIADLYDRAVEDRKALRDSVDRLNESLVDLRRPAKRKNRDWNDALTAVSKALGVL
jgi:hypothetical protein